MTSGTSLGRVSGTFGVTGAVSGMPLVGRVVPHVRGTLSRFLRNRARFSGLGRAPSGFGRVFSGLK